MAANCNGCWYVLLGGRCSPCCWGTDIAQEREYPSVGTRQCFALANSLLFLWPSPNA